MMLTEKECRDALDYLYAPLANTMVLEMSYNLLIDLIDEHFKLVEENKILNKLNDEQACAIRESFFTQTPCQPIALYKPRPYKFEELKPNMWICDDKPEFEDFRIIKIEKILTEKECGYLYHDKNKKAFIDNMTNHAREFEKSRFFPITKAMQYQKEVKDDE